MTPSRPASKHSDEDARATQVGAPGQPDYTFYTYDAHGNVATRIIGGTTHTYTWDGEGSLLGVAGPTPGPITYDVDAKGRRVGKRVNGTLERQWMYDGQLRIVAEVVYTPLVRYRVYGYVPERHLPVLMLEKVSGAESQYRIYGDHLGSLRAVVRVSDGKAIQTMRHGPWGEVEDDSVASTFSRVPFGFAGGIYDEVTGLVRFGAREYDARTGRWLSKDEARFGGGENFFEYAGGDPVNVVDLTGLAGGSAIYLPTPEASGGEKPVGGVCIYTPPTPAQRCTEKINDCTRRCNVIIKETYRSCTESTGEQELCEKAFHQAAASCYPLCRPESLCR